MAVLNAVGKVLMGWAAKEGLTTAGRQAIEHGLSEIHGTSGVLLGWEVRGPVAADAAADVEPRRVPTEARNDARRPDERDVAGVRAREIDAGQQISRYAHERGGCGVALHQFVEQARSNVVRPNVHHRVNNANADGTTDVSQEIQHSAGV